MKFSLRTMLLVIVLIAVALGAWHGLVMWNKSRNCAGRAQQYAEQAAEWRRNAAEPQVSPADAAAMKREADEREMISLKYQRVADRPWLPYPSYPLLTTDH
jgi:hypothetical protein